MITCMTIILELVLFILFVKASVYALAIGEKVFGKVYEKLTDKINKM